jgi:uncharacterized membrane protein YphA (DoxX/SURF4 family)
VIQGYSETSGKHLSAQPHALNADHWSSCGDRELTGYGVTRRNSLFIKHASGRVTAEVLTELLGGLAVLLGAFVTIASVPMTAVLLVAIFKVHLPYRFRSIKLLAVTATGAKFGPVGYDVILLYIACVAALVIGGSGPFAIDGLVRKRFEARTNTSRIPAAAVR